MSEHILIYLDREETELLGEAIGRFMREIEINSLSFMLGQDKETLGKLRSRIANAWLKEPK